MSGESVESVLHGLDFDDTLEAWDDCLRDLRDWSDLSYEEWVRPMKLSGGRICLHIDRGIDPDWYVRRTNAGILEATEVDYYRPWTMGVRELREILSGDAVREGRVSPVLHEETPFNGGEP